MRPLSLFSRPVVRGVILGAVGGVVLGGGAMWWLMRRQVEGEARRLGLGMMAQGAAGPRVPAPLAGGGGRTGVGTSGVEAGAGGVPVVPVADDLEVSFKALLAVGDPSVRQLALQRFLEALPEDRWPEFFVAGREMGDRGEFDDYPGGGLAALGILETALAFMVQQSPEGLLDRVAGAPAGAEGKDPFGRDDQVVASALRFWAARDLPAALAYFERSLSPLPPEKQTEAAKGLARELVKQDPAAAFAWIRQLPEASRGSVAHGAFQTLSHIDSEAALRYLVSEKDLPNRDEFAEQMAKGWAATKPEEALAWARGLPDDLSPRAVVGAMEHLAQKDFAAALGQAVTLAPAQQDAALKVLADTRLDPSQVSGLLPLIEQAPEGPGRAEAARRSLNTWAGADPEAASAWVAAQPAGPTRDAAIQGFGAAVVASRNDPEAGLEWTASVNDPGERRTWLGRNVKSWAAYDPDAARAWVQSSPRLNDADREVLLPLTRK